MAEPTTPAFIAVGVISAALGPLLGPAALIVFGAVAGSMLAMSRASTPTRIEALKFVAVGVMLALAITGLVSYALERWLDIPAYVTLMPMAAVIGAARNAILVLMDKVVELIGAALSVFVNRGGK